MTAPAKAPTGRSAGRMFADSGNAQLGAHDEQRDLGLILDSNARTPHDGVRVPAGRREDSHNGGGGQAMRGGTTMPMPGAQYTRPSGTHVISFAIFEKSDVCTRACAVRRMPCSGCGRAARGAR